MKVFTETQRFNQWWLILLGVFVIITILHDLYTKFEELQSGSSDVSIASFIVSLIITILVFVFIFATKLKTRIDETGISYQFFPIHFKTKIVAWDSLSECYVRKYNPVLEYGGWGIRGLSKKGGLRGKGMAFNIRGNMGIQLIFKDGGKLLLGTQLPDKAKLTLLNYQNKLKSNSNIEE